MRTDRLGSCQPEWESIELEIGGESARWQVTGPEDLPLRVNLIEAAQVKDTRLKSSEEFQVTSQGYPHIKTSRGAGCIGCWDSYSEP